MMAATHTDLTFDEIQRYLRKLIGRIDTGRRRCVSSVIEFGSEGFGVLLLSWERPGGSRDDVQYEINSAAELAWYVRTGRIPRNSERA